jgi:hypothetical protein
LLPLHSEHAMRKTIILAIATAFLEGVSVVTGLARSVHGPVTDVTSTRPVVDPLAIGTLAAKVFPAT